jgi:hypothetical protein
LRRWGRGSSGGCTGAAEVLMARDDSIRQVRFDVIAVSGYAVQHLPAAF